MTDPSEYTTFPEMYRPPDPMSRRSMPNPVSEVSMMVHALTQAADPGSSSSSYGTHWPDTSRMMSSTQGPYSEYIDISRASAAPWRPVHDWNEQSQHSSSPSNTYDQNSPESGRYGEFSLHHHHSSSPPRTRGTLSPLQSPIPIQPPQFHEHRPVTWVVVKDWQCLRRRVLGLVECPRRHAYVVVFHCSRVYYIGRYSMWDPRPGT